MLQATSIVTQIPFSAAVRPSPSFVHFPSWFREYFAFFYSYSQWLLTLNMHRIQGETECERHITASSNAFLGIVPHFETRDSLANGSLLRRFVSDLLVNGAEGGVMKVMMRTCQLPHSHFHLPPFLPSPLKHSHAKPSSHLIHIAQNVYTTLKNKIKQTKKKRSCQPVSSLLQHTHRDISCITSK